MDTCSVQLLKAMFLKKKKKKLVFITQLYFNEQKRATIKLSPFNLDGTSVSHLSFENL